MLTAESRPINRSGIMNHALTRVAGTAVLSLALVAPGFSQERPRNGERGDKPAIAAADPFNGSWKINRARSKQTTGEPPLIENITIRIENGVEHYTVEVQNVGAPSPTRNRYEAKYNDGKWYPYVNQASREATSEVMMIKTEPGTEYRFMRSKDGRPTGVLMRRMAADGRSYTSTMMNLEGEVTLARVFDRQ